MKILHLPITRHWFNEIASGRKLVDYRRFKKHWHQRLVKSFGVCVIMRVFDEIHIRAGYNKDSPFMRVKHKETTIDCCKFPGEDKEELLYLIHLGEILEIRNWEAV